MANILWVGILVGLVFSIWVDGFEEYHLFNETELSILEAREDEASLVGGSPLLVGLTLIQSAGAKGAGIYILSDC